MCCLAAFQALSDLAWQAWLHIMCLAALQALSELGKCGCTSCAWQPFRRYQSLASLAAHYVPGSPSGVIRAWQAWLHIMSLAAPKAISELGKRGCAYFVPGSPSGIIKAIELGSKLWLRSTVCVSSLLRAVTSHCEMAAHDASAALQLLSSVVRTWQVWLHMMCLTAPQASSGTIRNVAAHCVPGSLTGDLKILQVWLHMMCPAVP